MRGPVALGTPGRRQPRINPSPADFFADCVETSLARLNRIAPEVLQSVDLGIEEVPTLRRDEEYVPLAAAIEATQDRPARVVIYRRPLEHRATSRRHLRRLVHRTVVEQLAALTARSATDIDPLVDDDED